jgi:hypothetical protein
MEGQPWRSVVFHTSESGNDAGAIAGVANWVKSQSSEYHLLWNPWTGQFRQLIAASQSARALRNGEGGYRTNRKGTRLIQVCIIGRTSQKPLAGGSPLLGWDSLRGWLDGHGIPHTDRTGSRSRGAWESSGVHRHADAPGNDHTDPGPIDFARLYGEPAPTPATRREPPMIVVRNENSGTQHLVAITGRAGIANTSDSEQLRKALADPMHIAVVSQGTWDAITAASPGR